MKNEIDSNNQRVLQNFQIWKLQQLVDGGKFLQPSPYCYSKLLTNENLLYNAELRLRHQNMKNVVL